MHGHAHQHQANTWVADLLDMGAVMIVTNVTMIVMLHAMMIAIMEATILTIAVHRRAMTIDTTAGLLLVMMIVTTDALAPARHTAAKLHDGNLANVATTVNFNFQ